MPDFDWENFLGNIGQGLANNVGNTLNNVTSNPQLLPSLASAYQYMNQANRYGERGEQLAAGVDPWGQYRSGYAQKLNDLYNDPSSIANNPAYQFRLSQGMGKTASAAQAKNGGWGNEFAAMENYAQGLASTEYDAEVKRLMQLGGANLDPTNAAKIQLDADRNQIEAERAALGFLGTALAPQPVTNVTNNNAGGGTGGNPGNGSWNQDGSYRLPNGTNIDVTKLAAAARLGDPAAIKQLFEISGGSSVDEAIRNLGSGGTPGYGTGDDIPYPYNPDEGMYPQLPGGDGDPYNPDTGYGSGDTYDPGPDISIPDIEDSLGSWFDP